MAELVRDFALDDDGDLAVVNGDFTTVSGRDATTQGVKIRVQTFRGEIWLDQDKGVDYFNAVFVKNADPLVVREQIKDEIAATPDVITVIGAQLEFADANDPRHASIKFRYRDAFSTLPVDDTTSVP